MAADGEILKKEIPNLPPNCRMRVDLRGLRNQIVYPFRVLEQPPDYIELLLDPDSNAENALRKALSGWNQRYAMDIECRKTSGFNTFTLTVLEGELVLHPPRTILHPEIVNMNVGDELQFEALTGNHIQDRRPIDMVAAMSRENRRGKMIKIIPGGGAQYYIIKRFA